MIARPQVWVTELAARFWKSVGELSSFPRDLRDVLWLQRELHVVDVPNLTLTVAAEYFARHGIACRKPAEDRPLAGCFGAYGGCGVVLFDPTLEPAEVRFTLAHEVAHYLHDYVHPRQRVASRIGPSALEVLDGRRTPTNDERLAAVLRGVSVACHTHFLDRDRSGRALTVAAREAEESADRLAYELLAPFDAVKPNPATSRAELIGKLTSEFGLPQAEARKYAAILVR